MKCVVLLLIFLLQSSFPHFQEVQEHSFDGRAQLLCAEDVDNDLMAEIIIWDEASSVVMCYDCTGSLLWTVDMTYPLATGAAEDVDDDGLKEIFLLEDMGQSGDIFYGYRVIQVESDGIVSWRKFIEISVESEVEFLFVNVDGKPGKEVIIANRVLLQEGFERLAFAWDRIIVGACQQEETSFFLVAAPEESWYELYTFEDMLWQGQQCDVWQAEAGLQPLLCALFVEAGICPCEEDWDLQTVPVMKSVRLWYDYTGNGTPEALFVTNTYVQLVNESTTIWMWESPRPIEEVIIAEMTGDRCSEIVVIAPSYPHVPSMYVLNCTGELQSAFALNMSGTPAVLFSDLDGDGDTDFVVADQRIKKSSLHIYTNTLRKGPLDRGERANPLKPVDPSSTITALWDFYYRYRILVFLMVAICVIGVLYVVKRKKSTHIIRE
ncbi:MAG: hypothetical protein HXS46_12525 [Theionarchaea archaeon]|nr:hypothetical protein [Theionarchaea archaeon]